MATVRVQAAGSRKNKWLNAVLVNGILGILCIMWLIPTLGLLVSSIRERSDIVSSGWWTVFPHTEYQSTRQIQLTAGYNGP